MNFDKNLKEECGVIGIFNHPESSNLAYLGLYALQHRGQEACGIISKSHKDHFYDYKSFGLVSDVFSKENLSKLKGHNAIGHVRYSTHGGKLYQNIQPLLFSSQKFGSVAIAHNGHITNANILKSKLESDGHIFTSTSDTEILIHLLAKSKEKNFEDKIKYICSQIHGAYSIVMLNDDKLYAFRDSFGFRPMVIGKKDDSYIVSSETCVFDLLNFEFVKELLPGELAVFSKDKISYKSISTNKENRLAFCSFEPIYFSRPDSIIFGIEAYDIRKKMGRELAKSKPVNADVVIAVPSSGVPVSIGYGEKLNIPVELGLVRNNYVGRTFIEPSQNIRHFGVKIKLNPIVSTIKNKIVAVIDDSIVRGTTSAKIVQMIKNAGAKQIHMRIGSPPVKNSCYFGVDTPSENKLLANIKSVEEIKSFLKVDSIEYLEIDSLKKVFDINKSNFCYACFDGLYPEKIFKQ